jgi:hypothetical protein
MNFTVLHVKFENRLSISVLTKKAICFQTLELEIEKSLKKSLKPRRPLYFTACQSFPKMTETYSKEQIQVDGAK